MNELKKKKKFFRAFWQASLSTYSNDILSQYPTIVYDPTIITVAMNLVSKMPLSKTV